ncbi:MAG: RagB/SusD family nutrient uptake outer membrane protein [Flavobacterium sp.]
MKKSLKKMGLLLVLMVMLFPSCTNDLNQFPIDGSDDTDAEELFKDPASYKQFLAKLYAGLAVTGQSGPAGNGDISGVDEGTSQYIRGLWLMQELTTDLAVIAWNDDTIKDFHAQTWSSLDTFIAATFSRFAFQIVNCNEFLRQTTDEKLASRGIDAATIAEIQTFRAEARYLRALTYWHLVDTFGGGSIVTENSPTSFYLPDYSTRAEIYKFIDEELTSLTGELKDARTNELNRVDKAAAWMLHAKLYMNAKVYIGTERYAEALPLINKVIASGYTIHNNYKDLFLADNDKNGAQNEFIFAVSQDGLRTKTFGGTTFLVHASVGGSMKPEKYGINSGWAGIRTTSAFVNKFNGSTGDVRGNFYTDGQNKEIKDLGAFTDGYAVQKFSNLTKAGVQGSDKSGDFVDTDFPIFRLADAYLMYAECNLRGAGGSNSTALTYVNALRTRANAPTVSLGELNLDFILDERAKELHWECHRRTDLIRFNKFTGGSYLWPWKGNIATGTATPSNRNIFPIPAGSLAANPKLQQNPGY